MDTLSMNTDCHDQCQLIYLEKILDCAYEMKQSKPFQLHRMHLPHLNITVYDQKQCNCSLHSN